jgi:HD-GYP domain-containing protein (c-di-GMP phosphodiesterase class II)
MAGTTLRPETADLTGEFRLQDRPQSVVPALRETQQALDTALISVGLLLRAARRGQTLDVDPLLECARQIARQTVVRADAMLWLARAEQRGGYLQRRAVGSAVVCVRLGWHLGFDGDTLAALAAGMLLLDVGKVAVPVPILAKPDALDVAELAYVRRHVERGLQLVAQSHRVPARAVEMIAGHHERIDGSGYPARLTGTRIPLFGRLAAIVDSYDALTLNRRYAAAMSPHGALRFLDGVRDEKFDGALVGELIRALGHWPTGTWVELQDGSVGIVCAQRTGQPLGPLIIVALDRRGKPLAEPHLVEATQGNDIVRAVPPQTDPAGLPTLEPALAAVFSA